MIFDLSPLILVVLANVWYYNQFKDIYLDAILFRDNELYEAGAVNWLMNLLGIVTTIIFLTL